ncbi:MAG: histidine ammonia-lyase [Bernardetiaceae bacterium]
MFHYGEDHLTAQAALDILENRLSTTLTAQVRARIAQSAQAVGQIAEGDTPVYGINTGFGKLCTTVISKEHTQTLQRNLLLSHSVGVGEPLSKDLSQLMLILKIHALAQGFSGVSLPLMDRLLWHLSEGLIPVVPSQGSLGASGDLAPLAHLFLPLLGLGYLWQDGAPVPAGMVLQKHDTAPLDLGPKEAIALINGTQLMTAHAVMVLHQLNQCLRHADLIGALMLDALMGSVKPFAEELHRLRPYAGSLYVAQKIRQLLDGSQILAAHQNCGRVQDPYSLRCIPQVHGASWNAWLHLREIVDIELNAVTDNPLVFSASHTISGGNFHGQPIALPLDYACLAAAELGSISERRVYFALDGQVPDTPALLMRQTGLNSGFMILQYTAAALVSENKGLCFPASADSIPSSLGQEDHVSMGAIGARKALRVCDNLQRILAIELLCAAQAMEFRRPLRSSAALEAVHAELRTRIPKADQDRLFADDIALALELIQSGTLLRHEPEPTNKAFAAY